MNSENRNANSSPSIPSSPSNPSTTKNRSAELKEYQRSLEQPPAALDQVIKHAQKRAGRRNLLSNLLLKPAATALSLIVAFALLVNFSAPFAAAVEKVPILGDLVRTTTDDPSLDTAIANEYVQIIGQQQTIDGITIRVEYIVIDELQVNVFYTVSTDVYSELGIFTASRSVSATSISSRDEVIRDFDELHWVTIGIPDIELLENPLLVEFLVQVDLRQFDPDLLFRFYHNDEITEFPKFAFELSYDPSLVYIHESIAVNQSFELDGYSYMVTSVDIYPTQMRVHFDRGLGSGVSLSQIGACFMDETGQRFYRSKEGELGDAIVFDSFDSGEGFIAFDSPFFAGSRELTMYITSAELMGEEGEFTEIDLPTGAASNLPDGVVLEGVEMRDDGVWELTFSANRTVVVDARNPETALRRYVDGTYPIFSSGIYSEPVVPDYRYGINGKISLIAFTMRRRTVTGQLGHPR